MTDLSAGYHIDPGVVYLNENRQADPNDTGDRRSWNRMSIISVHPPYNFRIGFLDDPGRGDHSLLDFSSLRIWSEAISVHEIGVVLAPTKKILFVYGEGKTTGRKAEEVKVVERDDSRYKRIYKVLAL